MTREDALTAGDFRVTRHYANGRVQILRLEYAGGLRHQLELAPKDKLTIRESDSGSFVDIDGRLAGMVQTVNTASDRVVVLRFDHIDQLIGDRFRDRTAGLQLAYEGVFHGGRVRPEWTMFLESWLTDKLKGPILNVSAAETGTVTGSDSTELASAFRCRIKVDVIAWEKSQVANPAWANVQSQLQACGKKGFLNELNCGLGRSASANTPRQATQHKVTFNAAVTPRDGQSATKLVTRTVLPGAGPAQGQTELDVRVLQNAVGPTLKDLLEATSCQ